MHNASLQDVEARLLPEGAGRSPERPMPALMFIPQPASELVVDIFVNQPEVSSGVEPGEVRTPTPQDRVEPRSLLAYRDSRFPPDEHSDFVPNTLHRTTRGPAIAELPADALLYQLHQQFMVDRVEVALEIEIDH